MTKPIIIEGQEQKKVFEALNADKMRQSPETTQAVILARGPGIECYNPYEWIDATKYGVNAIQMLHKVRHLVALDDPYLLPMAEYNEEEIKRIEFLKKDEAEYFHHKARPANSANPITQKNGYTVMRTKYFSMVGLWDVNFTPHWMMSVFTAAALAARHGHTEIVVYGVTMYGHKRLESNIWHSQDGWRRLKATMNHYGINLYIGHEGSALNGILPLYIKQ